MTSIDIVQEVQQNFIDSSYDVNTNRAFPDVRDGLKPGMRACLWTMYKYGFSSNKPHVKSAKIDGMVAANLWPHGTTAIYETFARMSQPFTNNIPEVDFHGANGNVILGGDSIAADRYTESRLAKIAEEGMLTGVEKNTVPMILNFSEDEYWPKVLPAVFPRLLVNGSQGIGVSIAQTWLPHSLTDTANIIINYIKTNKIDSSEYYPDFPTGGTIVNKDELDIINKTGKGKVILEASYKIERNEITFYEMPYQVYIEPVIEKIKELVNKDELNEISNVYNKSDKTQIALVIECKRGQNPKTVVEKLFDLTPLRSQYNANQNGIISKTPVMLNLQQAIDVYIQHNSDCIKKEHQYDLDKANDRIEILEGLLSALASIDDIVRIIRSSENTKEAATTLQKIYKFTDNQCKAILDMRLSKLTHLDGVGLQKELEDKQAVVNFCSKVVNDEKEQKKILIKRLRDLAKKYGDERRTKVIQKDIIKPNKTTKKKEQVTEPCIISFNPMGYILRTPVAKFKDNSFNSFKTDTTQNVLLFSNNGKFYRVNTKKIKECGPKEKGTPIGTLITLDGDEKILSVFPNAENESKPYVLFAMENGMVKKTAMSQYVGSTQNLKGMVATKADCNIVEVAETNGNDVMLKTAEGMIIRFDAESVRASGRSSGGVKGITLQDGDKVVKCRVVGKSEFKKIPSQKRGGKGKAYENH